MTKRIRFIIFLILLLLFLLTVPTAILYSLGYRIDFQSKKIVQTGGLFLKIMPSAAKVSITPLKPAGTKVITGLTGQSKTFNKKTGAFQGSVFIKNLFPQKYKIEIEKQGFRAWEKILEVSGGLVTEAKNIILIPENPLFNLISGNIEDFWILPNGDQIIFENSARGLELFNIKKENLSPLVKAEEVEIGKTDDLKLTFSVDSQKALLKIKKTEQNIFYLLTLQEESPRLISLNFLGLNIKEAFLNPENSEEIFFVKQFPEGEFLFSANYLTKEISEPILANFLTHKINQKEILYLNNEGLLFKQSPLDKKIEYLNLEKPFKLDDNKEYQIIGDSSNILIRENDNLFWFKKDSQEFIKVFENLKFFEFSPKNKKIALTNNYELWVLFLEKQKEQPYKNKGDKVFLGRFSEEIGQSFWLSDQYLIFVLANNIKIAEIDDRDKINIVELSFAPASPASAGLAGEFEKIFFNQTNQKLYILTEGNLYSSEQTLR